MKATSVALGLVVLGGALAASSPLYSQEVQEDLGQDSLVEETRPERRPVLLIPGWMSRAVDLMALQERFVRDGWPREWILPLEFEDPVGSSTDHARELDEALLALQARAGVEELDVVAHSMGGLALWVLLQETDGLLPIRRVVFLATPFQGTVTAHLAWGEGGPEMKPGSEFLAELQAGGWPQRWVEALTVRTPLDVTVMPSQRATLLGITDRVVCCPTHQGLLDHEETYLIAKEFLLHGRRWERDGERFSPMWREWVKGGG